jgi:hypothetical protein
VDLEKLISMMRYHLRTLLILMVSLVMAAETALTVATITAYAKPAAEAASDYVMELGARAVYRGVCYATFD